VSAAEDSLFCSIGYALLLLSLSTHSLFAPWSEPSNGTVKLSLLGTFAGIFLDYFCHPQKWFIYVTNHRIICCELCLSQLLMIYIGTQEKNWVWVGTRFK